MNRVRAMATTAQRAPVSTAAPTRAHRALRLRALLLALLAAALVGASWPTPAAADAIDDWLNRVFTGCGAPPTPFRLLILGFQPGRLSSEYAEQIRLAIHNKLQRDRRFEISSASDDALLQELNEEVFRGRQHAETQQQLRGKFPQVHAAVSFLDPDISNLPKVSFTLYAFSLANLGCATPSERLDEPVSVRPADLTPFVADAARALLNADPPITVCPFEDTGSVFNVCTPVLTNTVFGTLVSARRGTDRLNLVRELTVLPGVAGKCTAEPGGVLADGKVTADDAGRLSLELQFRHGSDRRNAVVWGPNRTLVSAQQISCKPQDVPFLTHVQTNARLAAPELGLEPTKRTFAVKDSLGIRIRARAGRSIYCWVIDKDAKAYVALPMRGLEQLARFPANRTVRYPGDDFATEPIELTEPFENLFGCFGFAAPLPPELHEEWMSYAPSAATAQKELQRGDILRLLEKMRAQPSVVEAYTMIVVR